MPDEKRTKEEIAKENSNYLRGTIKEELLKNTSHFQDVDSKLIKFHGTYQQALLLIFTICQAMMESVH